MKRRRAKIHRKSNMLLTDGLTNAKCLMHVAKVKKIYCYVILTHFFLGSLFNVNEAWYMTKLQSGTNPIQHEIKGKKCKYG